LTKLSASISQWSAQKLSIFGRVHVAQSYLGSKAWHLATTVPLDPKALKRFAAMLWAFVQNNSSLDLSSNRHYSAWPRQTLIQNFKTGGLNAQDFESQLLAVHAKWNFKLLDPRHVAAWKLLPFYFLRNLLPAIDDSVFLADPSITRVGRASRWVSYLKAWFNTGMIVCPPPPDFECILNEPIWFNRFLYLHTDSKHGLHLKKETQESLIHSGFTHLSDLLSSIPSAGQSPWLTEEEAFQKTGSKKLGSALMSVVDLIPLEWSSVEFNRSREPLQISDWVVHWGDRYAVPSALFQIVCLCPPRIKARFYSKVSDRAVYTATNLEVFLLDAGIVKACVFEDISNAEVPAYVYTGNYATSRLLLSRLSWQTTSNKKIKFFEF
jgi:hypothetical protein